MFSELKREKMSYIIYKCTLYVWWFVGVFLSRSLPGSKTPLIFTRMTLSSWCYHMNKWLSIHSLFRFHCIANEFIAHN